MGILYLQRKDGFEHVIELKDERWKFMDYEAFETCIRFLTKHKIHFQVDYSFELFHIVIPTASVNLEPATKVFEVVKDNDEKAMELLADLIQWKTNGTRPIPDKSIAEELNKRS